MKKFVSFLSLFSFLTMSLFAEEAMENTARQNSLWQTLLMIGIAIVFFYFILWRPEKKRRKEMEEKRGSMQKGDQVTAMGIVGTLDQDKKDTVILKMVDGNKIEFLKGAISDVKRKGEVEEADSKKA